MWQTTREKLKFDIIRKDYPESFAWKVYNLIFNSFNK